MSNMNASLSNSIATSTTSELDTLQLDINSMEAMAFGLLQQLDAYMLNEEVTKKRTETLLKQVETASQENAALRESIGILTKQLDEKSKQTDDMMTAFDKLERLEKELTERDQAMSELKSQASKDLKNANAAKEVEIEELKKQHQTDIEELKLALAAQHESLIEKERQASMSKLAEMQRRLEQKGQEVQALYQRLQKKEQEHMQAVAKLKLQIDDLTNKANAQKQPRKRKEPILAKPSPAKKSKLDLSADAEGAKKPDEDDGGEDVNDVFSFRL